jgi:hypothetical protein
MRVVVRRRTAAVYHLVARGAGVASMARPQSPAFEARCAVPPSSFRRRGRASARPAGFDVKGVDSSWRGFSPATWGLAADRAAGSPCRSQTLSQLTLVACPWFASRHRLPPAVPSPRGQAAPARPLGEARCTAMSAASASSSSRPPAAVAVEPRGPLSPIAQGFEPWDVAARAESLP